MLISFVLVIILIINSLLILDEQYEYTFLLDEKYLQKESGLITHQHHIIPYQDIRELEITQSQSKSILGLYDVEIEYLKVCQQGVLKNIESPSQKMTMSGFTKKEVEAFVQQMTEKINHVHYQPDDKNRLINYILENKKQGFSKESIIEQIKKAGWTDQKITTVFQQIEEQDLVEVPEQKEYHPAFFLNLIFQLGKFVKKNAGRIRSLITVLILGAMTLVTSGEALFNNTAQQWNEIIIITIPLLVVLYLSLGREMLSFLVSSKSYHYRLKENYISQKKSGWVKLEKIIAYKLISHVFLKKEGIKGMTNKYSIEIWIKTHEKLAERKMAIRGLDKKTAENLQKQLTLRAKLY